ncbi:MAG: hypothetical protein AAGH53_02520 [Pseudomonadota bacterium]
MDKVRKTGMPVIGLIFLILAIVKFLQGGSWVVWLILAFFFGAFSAFGKKSGGEIGDDRFEAD